MGNRFVVMGGAGAMGRITVTDLVRTGKAEDEVVIADFDLKKAQALVDALKPVAKTQVRAEFVDVTSAAAMDKVLNQAHTVVNAVQYQRNIDVMEAALRAKCNYVDLGGLFHVTRKQMELDGKFKAIGRTAVLGMGAAPGITNLLAQYAANEMDQVTEIHCRVGSMDQSKYAPVPALAVSYSLKTILEEFSFEPAVYTKGEFTFVKPMSGDYPHAFPKPVGVQKPMFTIHSEVATLPLSYKDRGCKECSFKIAFDPHFVASVKFLRDLGMASHEPLEVEGGKVKPIDVVNKVAMSQPQAKLIGKLKQYEVVRTIVKGTAKPKGKSKTKQKITYVMECHTQGMPEWGIGLDIDTGSPPAVAAQMLADGEITLKGALAPEICVPSKSFFERLKKRKMRLVISKKSGWGFKT
ncbi:MAG: saccharopine dehydrogenase NADP-binding domain-containing protein [Bdellovibrionales bacterium]|nr:saccharopine dehydrogenase NADP-binding domain-containing protein [Bdellovibrionales bacterium]